jgi:hypothetical protein
MTNGPSNNSPKLTCSPSERLLAVAFECEVDESLEETRKRQSRSGPHFWIA